METEVVWSIVALLGGCALRTLLPYVVKGLNDVKESKAWASWPAFEPKYLSSFVLALIGYGVVVVTVPGAFEQLVSMAPVQVVALAYAGQDIARQVIKVFK